VLFPAGSVEYFSGHKSSPVVTHLRHSQNVAQSDTRVKFCLPRSGPCVDCDALWPDSR
jgi:hypothetical protein